MSGDSYFGDVVRIEGGSNNIGMVKNQYGTAQAPELAAQLAQLRGLVAVLRSDAAVAPEVAEDLDAHLAEATGDGQPDRRSRALRSIRAIAQTVGVLGAPVVELVNKILDLVNPHQ